MKFSRRSLVHNAGLVAGAGLLGLGTSATGQAQLSSTGRKPRALALIGDRYHNPDYIRVSLDKVFKDLDIPIDYTIQYDQIRRLAEKLSIAADPARWDDLA